MSREECIEIAQRIHDAWSDAGICYGRCDDDNVVTDDMKALAHCEDRELSSDARFIIEDADSDMQDDLYYDVYAEYIGELEYRIMELENMTDEEFNMKYNASSKKMKKSDDGREREIQFWYNRIRSLMQSDTIEELDDSYEYTWGSADYENEEQMSDLNEAYDRIKAEIENKNASTKKSAPSIHDMISQIRQNNNSLKKSRVDLGIRKAVMTVDLGNDAYGESMGTLEVRIPDSITFKGKTYPVQDGPDGVMVYLIRDGRPDNVDDMIYITVSSVVNKPWKGDCIQVVAIAPGGNLHQLGWVSSNFAYEKSIYLYDFNENDVVQAIQEAVDTLEDWEV